MPLFRRSQITSKSKFSQFTYPSSTTAEKSESGRGERDYGYKDGQHSLLFTCARHCSRAPCCPTHVILTRVHEVGAMTPPHVTGEEPGPREGKSLAQGHTATAWQRRGLRIQIQAVYSRVPCAGLFSCLPSVCTVYTASGHCKDRGDIMSTWRVC